MEPVLSPHERYLVVRAKEGWSVNLGADTLAVYTLRADAREAAARHVEAAQTAGRDADWIDISEDRSEDIV